jgi:hypothetical protein
MLQGEGEGTLHEIFNKHLGLREFPANAAGEDRMAEAGISLCHSGEFPDQPRAIAAPRLDPGDVAQHPVAGGRPRHLCDSDISREPEVEVTIEPLVVEEVDRGR